MDPLQRLQTSKATHDPPAKCTKATATRVDLPTKDPDLGRIGVEDRTMAIAPGGAESTRRGTRPSAWTGLATGPCRSDPMRKEPKTRKDEGPRGGSPGC